LQHGIEGQLVLPTAASDNEHMPRHRVLCGLLLFSAELVIPIAKSWLFRKLVRQLSPIFDE
jgi:hypothetical protein